MKNEFEEATDPQSSNLIEKRIEEIKRKIRGIEKEMAQKWPNGAPQK